MQKRRKKKSIKGVLHAVAAIIYSDEKKILMFKREGKEWERGWEIIKGGMYFGEKLREAVLREVKEEAGVDVKIVKRIPKIFWGERPYKGGKLKISVNCFICKYLGGKVKLGEPEHVKYKWMTLGEAKEKIWFKSGNDMLDKFKREMKW